MIKIQDILDFIGSKRPQYKMENWKNLKGRTIRTIYPIKDENGKLGYYNNENLKEGKWGNYYKNGQIYSKGNYVKGNRDGEWEFYLSDGKFSFKGYYVNGKEDGYWEEYSSSGKLIYKGNYVNGNKEGEWLIKLGDYYKKLKFKEGKELKKNIIEQLYDEKGEKIKNLFYDIHNNSFMKPYIDDNGQELGSIDDNGKLEGTWVINTPVIFSDKHETLIVNYKNGFKNGYFEDYFNDGKLKESGNLLNGYRNGYCLTSFINGYYLKIRYDDGTEIKPNRKIQQLCNEKGERINIFYDFKEKIIYTPLEDINGNLGYYNDYDEFQGLWKINSSFNNELLSKGTFKNGVKNGKWVFYEDGYINKGSFKNGLKNGEWVENDSNYRKIGKYVDDKRNGIWFFYFRDGTLSETGNFTNNLKNGFWKKYNSRGYNLEYYDNGSKSEYHEEYNLENELIYRVLRNFYIIRPAKDENGNDLGYLNDKFKLEGLWEIYQDEEMSRLITKIKFNNGVENDN